MTLVIHGEGMSELFFLFPGLAGAALLLYNHLVAGGFREYGWILDRNRAELWGPFSTEFQVREFLRGLPYGRDYEVRWVAAKEASGAAIVCGLGSESDGPEKVQSR
jgi:hypothetical protein